ncbi:MAG: hypothetical protein KAS71_10240 [Bacteroidales bacterium]|nr:hypothetical protein [Bacteroidales bacterium]
MKKFSSLSFFLFALLAIFVFSCEGPAGPPGADGIDGIAGADGADGTNGTDGTNGVDGNAVCLTCHNVAVKTAISADYYISSHGIGGAVGYAGSRNGCAMCHSHEGFVETQFTGLDTTATGFALPQPIQCASCHDFHETLDFEGDGTDYALRASSAVDLFEVPGTTIDFEGSSNLCLNCHQPRDIAPVEDTVLVGQYVLTNTRLGPHYGTQSTLLEGIGGYEVAGTVDYPTAYWAHRTMTSCVDCHMVSSATVGEGGHTWIPSVDDCVTCHSSATDFDVNGKQTEIDALHLALEEKLKTAGLLSETGSIVKGTYPIDQAGALWNYRTVYYDHSKGVHNYPYIYALLQNSIEVFN